MRSCPEMAFTLTAITPAPLHNRAQEPPHLYHLLQVCSLGARAQALTACLCLTLLWTCSWGTRSGSCCPPVASALERCASSASCRGRKSSTWASNWTHLTMEYGMATTGDSATLNANLAMAPLCHSTNFLWPGNDAENKLRTEDCVDSWRKMWLKTGRTIVTIIFICLKWTWKPIFKRQLTFMKMCEKRKHLFKTGQTAMSHSARFYHVLYCTSLWLFLETRLYNGFVLIRPATLNLIRYKSCFLKLNINFSLHLFECSHKCREVVFRSVFLDCLGVSRFRFT